MLASLLYPYDRDAPELIERWLDELEHEGRIRRYVVDGCSYLEHLKFLENQKIDKPSKSKLPPFQNPREDSTNAREDSLCIKDQGRDQGRGEGLEARERAPLPPIRASERSIGADGELTLAAELLRTCKLSTGPSDLRAVAEQIQYEAPERGGTLEAAEFIQTQALAAIERGEKVTIWWFKDRKFAEVDVYSAFMAKDRESDDTNRMDRPI